MEMPSNHTHPTRLQPASPMAAQTKHFIPSTKYSVLCAWPRTAATWTRSMILAACRVRERELTFHKRPGRTWGAADFSASWLGRASVRQSNLGNQDTPEGTLLAPLALGTEY